MAKYHPVRAAQYSSTFMYSVKHVLIHTHLVEYTVQYIYGVCRVPGPGA